jgi:hypothetical protein
VVDPSVPVTEAGPNQLRAPVVQAHIQKVYHFESFCIIYQILRAIRYRKDVIVPAMGEMMQNGVLLRRTHPYILYDYLPKNQPIVDFPVF